MTVCPASCSIGQRSLPSIPFAPVTRTRMKSPPESPARAVEREDQQDDRQPEQDRHLQRAVFQEYFVGSAPHSFLIDQIEIAADAIDDDGDGNPQTWVRLC